MRFVSFRVLMLNAMLAIAALTGKTTAVASAESSYSQVEPAISESREHLTIAQASQSFSDVPSDYWAGEYIQRLASQRIVVGDTSGNFRPDAPITRAEFAALLSKAFSQNSTQEPVDFSDVPTSYWGYEVIREASATGFLNGDGNERFRPNQNITRSEVLLALVGGLGYEPTQPYVETVSFYRDGYKVPVWMIEAIGTATEQQLVVNYPDVRELNFEQPATRAEVAAMIYQALVSQDSMPAVESDYIPSLTSETPHLAQLENICEDLDIENYIRELREYGEVDEGSEEPYGGWTASQQLATLEFKPIAYRLLTDCGRNAAPKLMKELSTHDRRYPIASRPEFISYYQVVLSILVRMGDDVVPTLISILENPTGIYSNQNSPPELAEDYEESLALYVASAIGSEAEDMIPMLIKMIQNDQFSSSDDLHEYRTSTFDVLKSIGSSSSEDINRILETSLSIELGEAIDSNDIELVQEIAPILHSFGYEKIVAINFLINVLENSKADPIVRGSVAITLAEMKASPSRVIPLLIENIQLESIQSIVDESFKLIEDTASSGWIYDRPDLILDSIKALGIYGDLAVDSVDNLATLLKNINELSPTDFGWMEIYLESTIALGNIGFSDSETISLFIQIIGDLPRLHEFPYSSPLSTGFREGRENIACAAATALSQQGEDVAIAIENSNLLSHEDMRARVLATHVMANFRPGMLPKLATELARVDSDSDPSGALFNCYGIGDRVQGQLRFSLNSIPYLVNAINSDNEPLRTFSAYALAGISNISSSDIDYVTALVNALKRDEDTRIAAAQALYLIGMPAQSASDDLLSALGDESFYVREAAASALFSVDTSNEFPSLLRWHGGGDWLEFFNAIGRFLESQ